MRKFKIGDKVRVVENTCGHGFSYGQVVTVVDFFDDGYDCLMDGDMPHDTWGLVDEELELVTTGASMEHKFNVGDKVRVVESLCGHPFDIGDIVTVVSFGIGSYKCRAGGYKDTWFLTDEEMELVTTRDTPKAFDPVSKPSHYNQYGIEAIDAIRASLGPEGFRAYCKGNVIKYLWRYEYKNGLEDLKKAQVYLNWMVESKEATE